MSAREPGRVNILPTLLVVVLVGVVVRFTFVDVLTKLTGTWIGGVESPRPPTDRGTAAAGRA